MHFRYHIYRQNQNRLNNNNSNRVNLNNVNNRPAAPPADVVPSQDQPPQEDSEESPLTTTESEVATQNLEPQVPVLDIVKTFLVSFVASIIPSDPAI